ncbi:hypothetical protein KKE06_05160, partial [Candidatus Micrarchaeota archaeon]|nr:hypothetical protein [Candidatus Micrarchaeota archaeon]
EVIGYFISEGDFKKDCLRISYIKEKEVSKHLRKAINSIFSGHLDEKRTKEIKFGRKIGKILFQQVFGIRPYAKNKTAPDFIFSAELDKIIAFLSGLFTGDGGVHAYKNGQRATIYFHTISKKLAGQVLALLTMTGAGPFYVQEIKRKNTLVFGKRIDAQDIYAVRSDSKQAIATLYNQGFRFLSERKNKRLEQIIKKRRKFLSREDDLYHRKIKKIEKINGPIDLYDFEVDATHNFFAGQILTHNCFGIFVGDSGLNTTFSAQQKMLLPANGNVAFISQSGALGVNILDWAATQPFGISKFVSYGNAMDIDESDLLEYLRNDTKTKIITVYLEGVKHGHKFLEIAKKVSKKKPIIVLKGGVTQEAHQATISHTGSLAGNTEVYKAVFKQSGIIQAEDLMQLFNFAKILESEPLPKGNQVQIITNGGGYGIITADAIVKHGLKLANMSATNKNQLKKVFPSTVSINNPMDLVGDADAKRYKIAVTTALKDPDVNMVLVIILFNTPPIGEQVVRELAKIKKTAKKPLIVASTGSDFTQKMRAKLEKNNIPTFEYPELAASSLQALWKYSQVYQPNKNKD